jgi:uncharacterized protein with NAD-binding domain and iron-sulfur cluster
MTPEDSSDTQRVSRRRFIARAGITAAGAYGALAAPATAHTSTRKQKRRHRIARTPAAGRQVAILGGGMGGLAAAHELAERGFQVTVFEPNALGGKARSIPVPNTGAGGRADLPGEHGFRFFPGFYQSVPDTMRRIPVAGNADGVFDNLVNASQELLIFPGGEQMWAPPSSDSSGLLEGMETLVTAIGIAGGVPANEIEYFVRKMLVFLTSCDARRVGEWEYVGWWEFTNAAKFSTEYQEVFGTGLTKDLVAAKGTLASTRTVGLMAEAFVYSELAEDSPYIRQQSGYGDADRLLDSPTNEAWIDPWVAYLKSIGVHFELGYAASKLNVTKGLIAGAEVTDATGSRHTVTADHYVAAMPVEKARVLFDAAVRKAAPELALLDNLQVDYMNGIQFFLNKMPAEAVKGHVAFLGSAWALTSIDQGLFWKRDIQADYGNGSVVDVYSVDISNFFAPGILYGKEAVDCTAQEIANEVWAQLKQGLNVDTQVLTDDMLVTWFLDPAVTFPTGGPAVSTEPLLINTAGSLPDRPNSYTSIPNLFLAADYVKVNVDLATMEGANEAGRQACNAILQATGSSATPASLGKLWQPSQLDPEFDEDAKRYAAGQPNLLDIVPASVPA